MSKKHANESRASFTIHIINSTNKLRQYNSIPIASILQI
jgi:hypothetical protein